MTKSAKENPPSAIRRPKLVVLESTTYPGTTDTELREVLEAGSGLEAGEGFHLAFSPEREDPGRKDHSVRTIPKVMGGYTPKCLERCVELYSLALDAVHPVSSCRVAEALNDQAKSIKCSRKFSLTQCHSGMTPSPRASPRALPPKTDFRPPPFAFLN